MATAKPHRPLVQRVAIGLLLLALLIAVAAALLWPRLRARALLGTAYGARIACTCHYVERRDLAQCRQDFPPSMSTVRLSDDAGAGRITASVPLLATQSARYQPETGCLLERWMQ